MKIRTVLTSAALLGLSSAAYAAPINVGGVVWDPTAPDDFTTEIRFVQEFLADPAVAGTELRGWGDVTSLNFENNFCPSCELTFGFGGFLTDGAGGFQNGFGYIDVFVDSTPNYSYSTDRFNRDNAIDGDLWIRFVAGNVNFMSTSADPNNPFLSGFLNVEWFLDDDTALAYDYFVPGSMINGSDAYSSANATFGFLGCQGTTLACGNGTLGSATIPEPATIGILGLGLLGLGGMARRKKA